MIYWQFYSKWILGWQIQKLFDSSWSLAQHQQQHLPRLNKYLLHAGVVQEGEQWLAVSGGGGLIVHHSDLDPLWVSTDTQTDQRDLDDGQQELETQRAAKQGETVRIIMPLITTSPINYKMFK